jgi:hypothetical protein
MTALTDIDLAKKLKIKPRKAINYLLFPLGEVVKEGDLLAKKKTLLSKAKKVFSPVSGRLERLEEETGKLIIKEIKKPGLKEKIAELKSNLIIKKKSNKKKKLAKGKIFSAEQGFGFGKGEILVLNQKLKFKDLSADCQGKIIYCPKIKSKGLIFKASALGAAGLITESIGQSILAEIKDIIKEQDFALLIFSPKSKLTKKRLAKLNDQLAVIKGKEKKLKIF